jgi:hypothetical protein
MRRRKRNRNTPTRWIEDISIYKRTEKETGNEVQVAYFDDWTTVMIGAIWNDQYTVMLETMRISLIQIEEYWMKLRKEFYDWCREHGVSGWGVHLYDTRM